jgi:hypothetical protein
MTPPDEVLKLAERDGSPVYSNEYNEPWRVVHSLIVLVDEKLAVRKFYYL